MRKSLAVLLLCLGVAVPARAQITPPYTFTAGTVANPDEVNANFAKFTDALNRTGGTMTGTLISQQITPSTTNTYDLGTSSLFFRTGYLRTSMIFGQTTANYTLTWANPASARAISIADPGGTDVFTFNAATQTLTNKTITAPVLGGSITGTYTLAGTPTFPATVALTTANNAFTGTATWTKSVAASNYDLGVQNTSATGFTRILLGNDNAAFNADWIIYGTSHASKASQVWFGSEAAYPLIFQTNGTARWGINAAGDHALGATLHIVDSIGTPTCLANCTSITAGGTDYAFEGNITGAPTSISFTFGHTFASAPQCTANGDASAGPIVAMGTVSTINTLQVSFATGGGGKVHVQCRGY